MIVEYKVNPVSAKLIKKQFQFNTKQQEFLFDTTKYKLYVGGIRSGKTYAGACAVIRHVIMYPGSHALVVSPNFSQMQTSTLHTFLEICPDYLIARRVDGSLDYNVDKKEMKMYNGSVIYFRSADNPDTIRGMEVSIVWLDEGGQLPDAYTWNIMIGRMSEKCAPQYGIVTTTPNGMNWLYDFFIASRRKDTAIFTASTMDNAENLPKEYIASMKDQYSGNVFRQELLGEFVGFEGLVYNEFDQGIHIKADHPDPYVLYGVGGMDFGLRDPTVLLAVGIDLKTGITYVMDEICQTEVTIADLLPEIQRFSTKYCLKKIYADPSRPDLIETISRKNIPIEKGNNEILNGIMAVSHKMHVRQDGTTQLYISPKCKNLISELQMYRYSEKSSDRPIDKYNHSCDALRYSLASVQNTKLHSTNAGRFRIIKSRRRW